jgi:hypothetical protein
MSKFKKGQFIAIAGKGHHPDRIGIVQEVVFNENQPEELMFYRLQLLNEKPDGTFEVLEGTTDETALCTLKEFGDLYPNK